VCSEEEICDLRNDLCRSDLKDKNPPHGTYLFSFHDPDNPDSKYVYWGDKKMKRKIESLVDERRLKSKLDIPHPPPPLPPLPPSLPTASSKSLSTSVPPSIRSHAVIPVNPLKKMSSCPDISFKKYFNPEKNPDKAEFKKSILSCFQLLQREEEEF
jgi:hypothetical protein